MKASELNRILETRRNEVEADLATLEALYLRLITRVGGQAAKALRSSSRLVTVGAAGWQPPPEGTLFNPDATATYVTSQFARTHQRIFWSVAGAPLTRAGINWDVRNPFARHFLTNLGLRTGVALGQAVQPVIASTVADAYDRGLSVPDTAALISEQVIDAAPAQARMLARTDLNGLANGASVMAATLVGVTYKQWLTAEDDRVRETHAEADGQTVPVDQPFDVGGESLDYPGDPSGSDEEVCNCRCTVIYTDSLAEGDGETASGSPSGRVPSRIMANRIPARGFTTKPIPLERVPARGFAAAVTVTVEPEAPAGNAATVAWTADLAFEGAATEDGRYILPDALTWRGLPISLGAMFDTTHADVVTSAPVAGKITSIEKISTNMDGDSLPSGTTAVRGSGVFDTNGEDGAETARMVSEGMMNGVSVDLSADDWCFRDPATGALIEPSDMTEADMEGAMMGDLQYAIRSGTIMGATVCPMPAFADARIACTASGHRVLRYWVPLILKDQIRISESYVRIRPVTASAAGLAPAKPPAAWFAEPEADRPTPLTVTKDGRVFGHMALWDSCHTGYPGQCIAPPRSPSGYAYFNLGEVECADGTRIAAGALTLDGLHADTDRPLSPQAVRTHYEHTGVVAAFVRATDGKHGIWVAGTLRADLPERYARDLMGAKPSGDWRQVRPGGPLEMLGVRAVNFPGFPVPRLVASALAPSGMRAELVFADAA